MRRAMRWVKSGLSISTTASGCVATAKSAAWRTRRRMAGMRGTTSRRPITAVASSGKRLLRPCAAIASPPTPTIVDAVARERLERRHQLPRRADRPTARRRPASASTGFSGSRGHAQGATPTRNRPSRSASAITARLPRISAPPASTAMPARPDCGGVLHGLHADHRQVCLAVLDRLGRFGQNAAALGRRAAQMSRAGRRRAPPWRRCLPPPRPRAPGLRRRPPPGRCRARPARARS